jgi:NAD(P)-dependent dehydrogenase (short-subunit alcohol dehydrogenase family)
MWGFATTVDEVIDGVDLGGKAAVVTGASSGPGFQTAATLASAGAEVIAAVRDPDSFRASPDWADLGELTTRIDAVALGFAATSNTSPRGL